MARPKGSKDSKPRVTPAMKQSARAAAGGIMPLEVMLLAMRGTYAAAMNELSDLKRVDLLIAAHGFAKDAAPYLHPKLSSVVHKGDEAAPLAFVIYGEREAEDTEAWAQLHGPETPAG